MFCHKRRALRIIACFLLLESIGGLVAPTVSWATSGPSQPEFTNYQAPGATDMVQLSTGDFSYSLPVLDIPGPERSFSLPLTYNSGIQLEQEASWVGLGWSMNAGAIARSVIGYPDDANNEPSKLHFDKLIYEGTSTAIIPGIWNTTWNSNTGSGGSLDLLGLAGLNWEKGRVTGADLIGIGYQEGAGFGIDGARLAGAAVTIASLGTGGAAALGKNVTLGLVRQVANSMEANAIGMALRGGVSGFNNRPDVVQTGNSGSKYITQSSTMNVTERRYGSLYFGSMSQATVPLNATYPHANAPAIATSSGNFSAPLFNGSRTCGGRDGLTSTETASDIFQYGNPKEDGSDAYYTTSRRPVSIAHDYYSVMGQGVSGTIRPYRLDVGSVAYPKLGRDDCQKHQKYMVVPYLNNYKVPFRYEGSLSNTYDYHQYTPTATNNPTGIDAAAGNASLVLTDPRLNINTRIGAPRKGLNNGSAYGPQLVQGKHTVWYSNREIEQMATGTASGYPDGFLNFDVPVVGNGSNDSFRHQLPGDGIGAFAVTAEDGTTYHYSLPVYQFKTYSESNEVSPYAPNGSSQGKSTEMDYSTNSGDYYSMPNHHVGYATTWLLTAITSPDYIDRNNSGTVDAGDWGGWVQFSYGKFSSHYKWRQPYIGNSYSDAEASIRYEGHTEGYKETYYLDRIATRTHTALFVKSVRKDARGHFRLNNPPPDLLNINDTQPASSLRLDEIILLDNASLAKLESANGIRASNDPTATPAFSNDTNQNGGVESVAGDALSRVLDTGDLTVDTRIKTFIEANALKRIHFNYGYDLCRGTPNAFDYGTQYNAPLMDEAHASVGRQGKLTLKSVSFFGPTIDAIPTKIIPDFTFSYESATESLAGTNPMYGKEKWDAFGMYCAGGAHNTTSHVPSSSSPAAPWTLRKITSPLGGTTEIAYERDQYAHVSEFGTRKVAFHSDGSAELTLQSSGRGRFVGNLVDAIHPGDILELNGTITFGCQYYFTNGGSNFQNVTTPYKDYRAQVVRVTNTQVFLDKAFGVSCMEDGVSPETPSGSLETILPDNTVGGDVRVSSISTTEDGLTQKYTNAYVYSNANQTCNSSGVISKEPAFIGKAARLFESSFDYPTTPVLYGQVTVLHGPFRNGNANDYTTREVYEFFTPSSDMVSEVRDEKYKSEFLNPDGSGQRNYQAEFYNNQVTVRTGLIGQPKAVHVYNTRGNEELGTAFEYGNAVTNSEGISGQGRFTEGTMTNEVLDLSYFRTNRTTKTYVPTVLMASYSTRNGVTTNSRNELFDFYTGQVIGTGFTDSKGRKYHSFTVPAYTRYASMGAKGDNPSNEHMLSQQAAAYTVVEQPGNSQYDVTDPLNPGTASILSASVKTWKKDWNNYRVLATSGQYQDDATTQQPVWREQATYVWQSSLLKPDGSFGSFVNYTWNGAQDTHWVKASETVRYDHYSHGLETQDANGLFSAIKTGHAETQSIASAANARYTELAYSGAEDVPVDQSGAKYFGGEVVSTGTKADGLQGTPLAHTGLYSIQLAAEQNLRYRAVIGSDVMAGKPYRLSAWVNGGDLLTNAGRLYASVNGTVLGQTSITATTTKKAGSWYRLLLTVTVPATYAGQVVEFGCLNTLLRPNTAPVYFDDFRVCPVAAAMSSDVYDPRTNQHTYSLDNENLFTRYEYNSAGRLVRVYREAFDRPNDNSPAAKIVKEVAYNYAMIHFPTWISIDYRCAPDVQGNNNGAEERYVVDANPLNDPPTSAKWELNGPSPACAPPACDYFSYDRNTGILTNVRRLRGNNCEEAEGQQPVCTPRTQGGVHGYLISRTWIFPNGDVYEDPGYFSTNSCADINQQKLSKTSTAPPIQAIKRTK